MESDGKDSEGKRSRDGHRMVRRKTKKENAMRESVYMSYDELPLFLNAEMVAKVLGVSPSTGYELMHEKGFPVLRVGSRMVVPKEKFRQWVEMNVEGTV